MHLLILNGPNLNLLGEREPELYGTVTLQELLSELQRHYSMVNFTHVQSNYEGKLVDELQKWKEYDGVLFNPGAFSHYSWALVDALRMVKIPVVEVHFTNLAKREDRPRSLMTPYVQGIISGFGAQSYRLAVEWFLLQKGK